MVTDDASGGLDARRALSRAVWSLRHYAAEDADRVRGHSSAPLSLGDALEIVGSAGDDEVPRHLRGPLLAGLAQRTGTLPDFPVHEKHYRASHSRLHPARTARASTNVVGHDEALQAFRAYDIPDLCSVEEVVVGDAPAVWIYSEAEVLGSLHGLTEWVQPSRWPQWGPSLFLAMKPKDGSAPLPGPEWQQLYTEVTNVLETEFTTDLVCDYQRTDTWVGMTYDLKESEDEQILVDRGFLLATPLEPVSDATATGRFLVRALKIVQFADEARNAESLLACPMWTSFVRRSVDQAGKLSRPVSRHGQRHHGLVGTPSLAGAFAPGGMAATLGEEWVDCVRDGVTFYAAKSQRVVNQVATGTYGLVDYTKDANELFMRLARDWALAYKSSTERTAALAELNVDPSASCEYAEVLVVLGPGESLGDVSELRPVAFEGSAIGLRQITVTKPTAIRDIALIRMEVKTEGRTPGLYAGTLRIAGPKSRDVPALFYVSKARPAG